MTALPFPTEQAEALARLRAGQDPVFQSPAEKQRPIGTTGYPITPKEEESEDPEACCLSTVEQ